MRSLESIRKDIFRSADSLRLSKGQESRVFHRGNFLDQNAVIRSANAYAELISLLRMHVGVEFLRIREESFAVGTGAMSMESLTTRSSSL